MTIIKKLAGLKVQMFKIDNFMCLVLNRWKCSHFTDAPWAMSKERAAFNYLYLLSYRFFAFYCAFCFAAMDEISDCYLIHTMAINQKWKRNQIANENCVHDGDEMTSTLIG